MRTLTSWLQPQLRANEVLDRLGIEWRMENDPVAGQGFTVEKNWIGIPRPYWDGVLYGSTSFCLIFCERVAAHPLTEGCFPPGTELWVVAVPPAIQEAAVARGWTSSPYLCLPVHRTDAWPCRNWNAIPLKRPEDALRHLRGWVS